MNLSLSNMLSGRVSGLDPDAKGYVEELVAAGATVSGGQKSAINTFYKTGKSDGWYPLIKRLYLPIWAAAAPNAIDMIGLTSGTFNGTVTHAAGYVQGDGSTGYIDTGTLNTDIGMTETSFYLGYLNLDDLGASKNVIGTRTAITSHYNVGKNSSNFINASFGNNVALEGAIATSVTSSTGINTASKVGSDYHIALRDSSSWNIHDSGSRTYSANDSTHDFYGLGLNIAGTLTNPISARIGFLVMGTGLTQSQDEDCTLALKNLWETATGLTLP